MLFVKEPENFCTVQCQDLWCEPALSILFHWLWFRNTTAEPGKYEKVNSPKSSSMLELVHKRKKRQTAIKAQIRFPVYCSCMYKCTTPTFWRGAATELHDKPQPEAANTQEKALQHIPTNALYRMRAAASKDEEHSESSLVCSTAWDAQVAFNWGQICLLPPHTSPCPQIKGMFYSLDKDLKTLHLSWCN